MSQACFVLSFLQLDLGSASFPKGPSFTRWGMAFINHGQNSRCAHCCWCVTEVRHFQWKQPKNWFGGVWGGEDGEAPGTMPGASVIVMAGAGSGPGSICMSWIPRTQTPGAQRISWGSCSRNVHFNSYNISSTSGIFCKVMSGFWGLWMDGPSQKDYDPHFIYLFGYTGS